MKRGGEGNDIDYREKVSFPFETQAPVVEIQIVQGPDCFYGKQEGLIKALASTLQTKVKNK